MSIEDKIKHDMRGRRYNKKKYMNKCNKITLPTRKTGGRVTILIEPEQGG